MTQSTFSSTQDRVLVFDTTLRDGEQSPGFSMSLEEKFRMARALADLKIDVLEAGFPAASDGDFEAVQRIARQIEGPIIAGLARCFPPDIQRAWKALADAPQARLHVFLATSQIHRTYKLGMARDEIVRRTREGVAMARGFCADVEFSPEDASRTEPDFLIEVVEPAIEAGATTINIPDTVGYSMPDEFGKIFANLRRNVRGADKVVFSAHCHDDLGLAVANSLAAIGNGARQVECTINGIGERAGNASLEELVMALRTRREMFQVETQVDCTRLGLVSRLLTSISRVPVQPNKAIVGRNAFAHEAGIHQHGMMKNSATYEIMRPEDVGMHETRLVLGKHSGRHAGEWQLIASREGADAALQIHQDARLYAILLEPGMSASMKIDPGRGAWLQVAQGSGTVAAGSKVWKPAGDGLAPSNSLFFPSAQPLPYSGVQTTPQTCRELDRAVPRRRRRHDL